MEELNFIKVTKKSDTELVTQADLKCQQIIINRIKETYPDHGFIAEESTGTPRGVSHGGQSNIFKQLPRRTDPIWWVIDPIDGTNNFAHQMLLFSISIAAMYEGEPIVGVVFDPATDSMFTAVRPIGGRDGEAQLNGRRITAGEEQMSRLSSVGLDSHFDLPPRLASPAASTRVERRGGRRDAEAGEGVPKWVCNIMQQTRFRNLGTTALHLSYVAKGGLVAAVISRAKIWDIAAGAAIAETAGALVTDWQGGKLFPVDLQGYESNELQVLAANKKVHPRLIKMINSQ
jgi:myo-inositol-1(or 4)-monophosphatase